MRRLLVVTLAGTVVAAVIGPRGPLGGFWRPAPEAPHVHGGLLAGFLTEGMLENVAFGAGLAILLLGRKAFAGRTGSPARAATGWLAAVWLLASWMPHAALHQHAGMRPEALLPIEWIFHGGAIAGTGLLLWALLSGRERDGQEHGHAQAQGGVRAGVDRGPVGTGHGAGEPG
jgi:hypothetical protein